MLFFVFLIFFELILSKGVDDIKTKNINRKDKIIKNLLLLFYNYNILPASINNSNCETRKVQCLTVVRRCRLSNNGTVICQYNT